MIGTTFTIRNGHPVLCKVERVEEGVVYFKTLLEGDINVNGAVSVEMLEKLINEKNIHPQRPPDSR